MRRLFKAATVTALLTIVFAACGNSSEAPPAGAVAASLEDVCRELVKQSCDGLSTCCSDGATFDAFECTRVTLGSCLSQNDSEGVHAGTVIYDASAAKSCRGSSTVSCPTAGTGATGTIDEGTIIACNSIVAGYRPLGAECSQKTQCAPVGAGAYPECYTGAQGSGGGVCAKHVFGDTWGVDATTLTYTACHTGMYCSRVTPCGGAAPAQGKARFEFTGTCLAPAKEGEACGSQPGPCTTGIPTPIPCGEGLSCMQNQTGSGSKCVKPHALGEDCKDNFFCAAGLGCNPSSGKCETQVGVPTTGHGPFCYKPPVTGAGGSGAGGFGSGGFGANPGGAGFGSGGGK